MDFPPDALEFVNAAQGRTGWGEGEGGSREEGHGLIKQVFPYFC